MKAPDAALVRARAKAPLADLHVLHLSSADLARLGNHLERCQSLRSIYANGNALRDVSGLTALRSLWRIDLSDNRLGPGQLTPLASFPALGFLHLQRNQLRVEDLVCLRDVHILDLQLTGNPALLAANADRGTTIAYRMKVVALLPSVWTLDGHYVTTRERAQAGEAYDAWVIDLLARHSQDHGAALRFGSTADLWGGTSGMGDPDDPSAMPVQDDVLKLLQVLQRQPTRHPDQQDLYRLRAIASFHDRECDLHNAHAHFAPQKHSLTAKPMPKIRLHDLQTLSPRTRLQIGILLTAHMEFPLPIKLLTEALTIAMLSDGDCDSASVSWVQDLVALPVYGAVAVVSALRVQAIEDHEHASTDLSESVQLWSALAVVISTLLQSERHAQLVERATPDTVYLECCAFAVSLLSRAAGFPSKTSPTTHCELHALVETAKLASRFSLENAGFAIPTVLNGDGSSSEMPWKKTTANKPGREYRKPWSERRPQPTTATASSTDIQMARAASHKQRLPKVGEWLEVRPRLFFKIHSVSVDGEILTASPTSADDLQKTMLTLRIDQVARVSRSMWRLISDDAPTLGAVMRLRSQAPVAMKARLGKLHRDSEGFHKHGASRNQGYPNHSVSTEDLHDVLRSEDVNERVVAVQPQTVEVFSSTDTLDANYVLTSPAMISVQNAVASQVFREHHQAPVGLWNPIEIASFRVAAPVDASNVVEADETPTKLNKTKSKLAEHPLHVQDDWLELRRDMQTLLGIRPRSSSLVSASDSADGQCFLTSVPAAAEPSDGSADSPLSPSDGETPPASTSTPSDEASLILLAPLLAPRSTAKPRKLAALPWHQVSTKQQLLVASPVPPKRNGSSHSVTKTNAISLIEQTSRKEVDAAAASMAPRLASTSLRVPLQLTRCHVSLPSLSLISQK